MIKKTDNFKLKNLSAQYVRPTDLGFTNSI